MSNEALKPCPFCNSTGIVKTVKDNPILYQAGCSNAHCNIYPITSCFSDKQAAIAAWNKRATPVDCKSAEKTASGKCLGYQIGKIDDEPCDQCKKCHEYESYGEE